MPENFYTNDVSLFDNSTRQNAKSLISAQVPPSSPAIVQMQNGTDLLIADTTVRSRLAHFPDDLYDLRPESHLMRFLSALLGDSGVGQVRKRYLLARIQSSIAGSNFYDLDRFYGAIFGLGRRVEEALPIDPYVEVETPDEWDEILAYDALYRERIIALAAAIPLGATAPGIRQAAEAIVGVECEVYETWRYMDDPDKFYNPSQTGADSRAEIVVHVKKSYNLDESGIRDRVTDELFLTRVLNLLKPASTVLSIYFRDNDPYQNAMKGDHAPYFESDADYWEVVTRVKPSVTLSPSVYDPYPLSRSQKAISTSWTNERVMSKPIFTESQGAVWDQAGAVSSATSYSMVVPNADDLTLPGEPAVPTDINPTNFEVVAHLDGTMTSYIAAEGAIEPRKIQGGTAAAGGILAAQPYSGPRGTKVLR